MKKFTVRFTEEAKNDLAEIVDYVAEYDSLEHALYVLDKLEGLAGKLETNPLRGHRPSELDRIGVAEYREVHFKPYRIIYLVRRASVFIVGVFDGRRDMQSLLQRRLLR